MSRSKHVTTVYRAYSPTRDNAGSTFADHARAQSQAAVRNQFVDCDPNTDELADWYVQAGTVSWDGLESEHTIEQVARAIYDAMHRATDPYSVPLERAAEKAARALADAGLLAPAPLRETQAKNMAGETYRRWATDWERIEDEK